MIKRFPNIVLIVLDTARAMNFSCYGYYRETSPNIDKLSEKGILFENTITPAPWTLPAHASLLTGTYPLRHSLNSTGSVLGNDLILLPEVLRNKGYQTIGIANNCYIGKMSRLNKGFRVFEEPEEKFKHTRPVILRKTLRKLFGKWCNEKYEIGATRTNELAKTYIRQISKNEPYFIFLNLMDAHLPYLCPKKFRYMFLSKDIDVNRLKKVNQDVWLYLAGKVEMTREDFSILESLYDAQIRYLDYIVGNFIDFLRKSGYLDNTFLFIMSDHGENLGEHNLMGHVHNLYDTVLRIPLIVYYPGIITPGKRINKQVSLMDIFPTILEVLDIRDEKLDNQIQGNSLFNVINGEEGNSCLIAEYPIPQLEPFKRKVPEFDYSKFNRGLRAIRTDEFKYIWSSNGKDEFYDLTRDPGENSNLINNGLEKIEELKMELKKWVEKNEQQVLSPKEKEIDESIAKRLKALGYL